MATASVYKVGEEIIRENDPKHVWLVVRIVENDTSLVIDDEGKEMVTEESYVMLKSDVGEIDFVLLLHKEMPFATTSTRKIPGLPNLWRKNDR